MIGHIVGLWVVVIFLVVIVGLLIKQQIDLESRIKHRLWAQNIGYSYIYKNGTYVGPMGKITIYQAISSILDYIGCRFIARPESIELAEKEEDNV